MMDSQIISAIIAVCGVFVTVTVTFVIGLLARRFNYKHLYAETVSSNRMDWINAWHENISRFIACAEILHKHTKPSAERLKIEKELYEARAMITSRLNLNEDTHVAMLTLLNNFRIQTTPADFSNQREAVLALAREILKPEWERVKKEARGKKNV